MGAKQDKSKATTNSSFFSGRDKAVKLTTNSQPQTTTPRPQPIILPASALDITVFQRPAEVAQQQQVVHRSKKVMGFSIPSSRDSSCSP